MDQTAIPNLSCPDHGFVYTYNDLGSFLIANSWQECGKVNVLSIVSLKIYSTHFCYKAKQCKSNLQCYFWTWNYENRRCYLKNSYALTRRKTKNKRISGSKECQGKYMWISDTLGKNNMSYIKNSTDYFQTTKRFQAHQRKCVQKKRPQYYYLIAFN